MSAAQTLAATKPMPERELREFRIQAQRGDGVWCPDGDVLARDLSGAGESALMLRRWRSATWSWPRRGVLEARSGRRALRVIDPKAADLVQLTE